MKRTVTVFLLVVLAMTAGCSQAIKEGVGVARGAKGIYMPISPLAVSPLGQYTRFELGKFEDGIGGKVPRELLAYLPEKFKEQLAENELPNNPGGKTLLARGTILHYEDENIIGMLIGPLEEVVARVELVDKDSGKVLGVANCIGRTTTRVNKGVEKKADGLAKAIVGWIASYYPKKNQ